MKINVLWDSGSTLSFITFHHARKLNLQGKHIKLEIATIGGVLKMIDSELYTLYIKDEKGIKVPINVLGINIISSTTSHVEMYKIAKLFPWLDIHRIRYPAKGSIDLLIGFDYAAHHATCIDSIDHLLLLENRFGYSIAGSHEAFKEHAKNIVKHAVVLYNSEGLNDFYSMENLGINCDCEK